MISNQPPPAEEDQHNKIKPTKRFIFPITRASGGHTVPRCTQSAVHRALLHHQLLGVTCAEWLFINKPLSCTNRHNSFVLTSSPRVPFRLHFPHPCSAAAARGCGDARMHASVRAPMHEDGAADTKRSVTHKLSAVESTTGEDPICSANS